MSNVRAHQYAMPYDVRRLLHTNEQMPLIDLPLPPFATSEIVIERRVRDMVAPKTDWVIGVCHLSENPFVPKSAANVMEPLLEIKSYFTERKLRAIEGQASVSVLKTPTHGALENQGDGYFAYDPEKSYIGNDRATLLVELGSKQIRVEYFFRVMQTIPQQYETEPSIYEQGYCPKKARVWKISTPINAETNDTSLAFVHAL